MEEDYPEDTNRLWLALKKKPEYRQGLLPKQKKEISS